MSEHVGTLTIMVRMLVDVGVYDAHEISHLLAQSADRIVRWSAPDGQGRPTIVAPSLDRAFSFVDLVSLAVVSELWSRDVSEIDMRNAVVALAQETSYEKPLAHRQVIEMLATCGTSLVAELPGGWFDIGKGGQGAFEQVVKVYFRTVAYDDLGVAQLWRPAPLVLLDPRCRRVRHASSAHECRPRLSRRCSKRIRSLLSPRSSISRSSRFKPPENSRRTSPKAEALLRDNRAVSDRAYPFSLG